MGKVTNYGDDFECKVTFRFTRAEYLHLKKRALELMISPSKYLRMIIDADIRRYNANKKSDFND